MQGINVKDMFYEILVVLLYYLENWLKYMDLLFSFLFEDYLK